MIAALLIPLAFVLSSCTRHEKLAVPGNRSQLLDTKYTTGGTPLSPERRLRKLSIHLRGVSPKADEYAELSKAVKAGSERAFFLAKTKDYLSDERHVGKMIDRLDDLFRLKTSPAAPELRFGHDIDGHVKAKETYNSLDFLFESLARENLPWDLLLTGKNYRVPTNKIGMTAPLGNIFFGVSDLGFFNLADPSLPPSSDGVIKKAGVFGFEAPSQTEATKIVSTQFKEDDTRIAGAITTARFFNRYSTTVLNRSRGRAAAVFRIFLCDDMRAVVAPSAEEEQSLLDQAFPKPFAGHPAINGRGGDKHGTDPDCMACHYKLDPMGQAFVNSGIVLGAKPAPGALVYKRQDGTLVEMKAKGLGEMAKFIAAQPEYASCQVTQFWKWFIRGDKDPSPDRLATLKAEFENVGRRTNDFIAYLVNEPDFYETPPETTGPVTLTDVRHLLQRCDKCHLGVTTSEIPTFSNYPIQSAETHASFIGLISGELDLAHDGKNRSMPPKSSEWQPTAEDIAQLKNWVANRARNDAGDPTITEAQAMEFTGGAR